MHETRKQNVSESGKQNRSLVSRKTKQEHTKSRKQSRSTGFQKTEQEALSTRKTEQKHFKNGGNDGL